jgi:hypothetical protein
VQRQHLQAFFFDAYLLLVDFAIASDDLIGQFSSPLHETLNRFIDHFLDLTRDGQEVVIRLFQVVL